MRDGRILDSLTIEQLEARYFEAICRPSESWTFPPKISGLMGWRQMGREWSVMVDVRQNGVDDLRERLGLIERRAISLDRWFSARVGSEANPDSSDATNTSSSASPDQSDSSTEAIDA
jgi:hypothetical protein